MEVTRPAYDGITLHGRIDAPDKPKAVIVIVHGLAEHYGRYDYITDKLMAAGYAVVRFDHRGHGRSEGKPVYYDDYTQIVKDTDAFVELAKAEFAGLPLFIIGHSMGGYAAVAYGSTFPGKADCYAITGALTRRMGTIGETMDVALDEDAYIPNQLSDMLCSDPQVGLDYAADPLVAKEISVKIFRVLDEGVIWLEENPQLFVDPILVMHGLDEGPGYINSLNFYQEIASTDKSLIVYSGLRHELYNEYKKDDVIADTIRWFDYHLA